MVPAQDVQRWAPVGAGGAMAYRAARPQLVGCGCRPRVVEWRCDETMAYSLCFVTMLGMDALRPWLCRVCRCRAGVHGRSVRYP
eukprot:315546-Prymnesium_polylepis.1